MSWNPKIATFIYLTLVFSILTIKFIHSYSIPKEFRLTILFCLIIFLFEIFVDRGIFTSPLPIIISYLLEIIVQLIICVCLTFISWYIVLNSIGPFFNYNFDRVGFTIFIGLSYLTTMFIYYFLKSININSHIEKMFTKLFPLYKSNYDSNKGALNISLLGQMADILTFAITVLLLANSAYSAIESSVAKPTNVPKTLDLSKISEYKYLLPGIAVYSLATYYKIKDFLLKTNNETKSKETKTM